MSNWQWQMDGGRPLILRPSKDATEPEFIPLILSEGLRTPSERPSKERVEGGGGE
jgi:hypothetical protein